MNLDKRERAAMEDFLNDVTDIFNKIKSEIEVIKEIQAASNKDKESEKK